MTPLKDDTFEIHAARFAENVRMERGYYDYAETQERMERLGFVPEDQDMWGWLREYCEDAEE